jgi:hypothetical protein
LGHRGGYPRRFSDKKHLTSWSGNDKIITSVEELINKNSGVAIG